MLQLAVTMSSPINGLGNGGGHGSSSLSQPAAPKPRAALTVKKDREINESRVTFRSGENIEVSGSLSHMTPRSVFFEVYSPGVTLRLSESFPELKIIIQETISYHGPAVVYGLVDAGSKIMCEARLEASGWIDLPSPLHFLEEQNAVQDFSQFLQDWRTAYDIRPEFKVIIADMSTFFYELRFWLERRQLAFQNLSPNEMNQREDAILRQMAQVILPAISALFEKFETAAKQALDQNQSSLGCYMRLMLHPLVLCAPFADRTFNKPLGYAGDYEMVSMMTRSGFEGESWFAKIVHQWFVAQPPAEAHRNRLKHLVKRIEEETARVASAGRTIRIFNFACGPAVEVQNYLLSAPRQSTEFLLADFNQETLAYTSQVLKQIKRRLNVPTSLQFQKKSVHQLIKESMKRRVSETAEFDFIYCAGLFDYLSHQTCRQLMDAFYDLLAPGGLLLATNVENSNPLRHGMQHLLDWPLIYRDAQDMRALSPGDANGQDVVVSSDATGVNLFIEVRKPEAG